MIMAKDVLTGQWEDVRGCQDDCLIAIKDGNPVPAKALLALPPFRAVLMATVAAKAGVGLEKGTLAQILAEARRVGGSGNLGNWWERLNTVRRRRRRRRDNRGPESQ